MLEMIVLFRILNRGITITCQIPHPTLPWPRTGTHNGRGNLATHCAQMQTPTSRQSRIYSMKASGNRVRNSNDRLFAQLTSTGIFKTHTMERLLLETGDDAPPRTSTEIRRSLTETVELAQDAPTRRTLNRLAGVRSRRCASGFSSR